MSTLAQLQTELSRHILHAAPDIARQIQSDEQADAAQRLAVYAQGYRLRLLEVLQNEHPGLQALLAIPLAEQALRAYIDARPSTHRNARWYGDGLSEFLSQTAPWSAHAAAAQMAALEWDLGLAFDAQDQALLRLESLAMLQPEQWPGLPLRLAVHWRQRELDSNVAAIRLACDQQQAPPALCTQATQCWAIWRRQHVVRYRALEEDEVALLAGLQEGIDFATLCERLGAWHREDAVALRAAGLLRRWVDDEWLLAPEDPSAT